MSEASALTERLLRASAPGEALSVADNVLHDKGFRVERIDFDGKPSLYACNKPSAATAVAFAGHVDVVPPGDGWEHPPFSATRVGPRIYGRGAVDMKGAIACWLAALPLQPQSNALSVLLTSDEELDSSAGMIPLLKWLKAPSPTPRPSLAFALVGEPTARAEIGDHIKIGCKGSINILLTARGVSGHVAYFESAQSPLPPLLQALAQMQALSFPESETFGPTHLEIVEIKAGNGTCNMIPQEASARINIRFNDQVKADALITMLARCIDPARITMQTEIAGTPFCTEEELFTERLMAACSKVACTTPALSACGANSDARFLHKICPTVECGLRTHKAHQTNEYVTDDDLEKLTEIYANFIQSLG